MMTYRLKTLLARQQQEDFPFLRQKWPRNSDNQKMPTTGSPFSKPSGSLPPGEVNPLHMILAPERTNLIAPLST